MVPLTVSRPDASYPYSTWQCIVTRTEYARSHAALRRKPRIGWTATFYMQFLSKKTGTGEYAPMAHPYPESCANLTSEVS